MMCGSLLDLKVGQQLVDGGQKCSASHITGLLLASCADDNAGRSSSSNSQAATAAVDGCIVLHYYSINESVLHVLRPYNTLPTT